MYSLRSSFPFQGSDAKKNLARRVIHRITPCDHAHYKHGFLKHERISLLRGLSFVGQDPNTKLCNLMDSQLSRRRTKSVIDGTSGYRQLSKNLGFMH